MTIDISKLMYTFDDDDDTYDNIMHLTFTKIRQMNLDILSELHLDKETTLDYLKKLKGYRYVDEVNELKYGSFIRWIPITNPEYLPLHYSGIICDIKITDNGVLLVCKNFMHRHYTFQMDECLIFQKLTPQEEIVLHALEELQK
jgi:hypothetical protein